MERDIKIMCDLYAAVNFNSHAHVERDRLFLVTIYSINISTHTLTWSVTIYIISITAK